MPEVTRKAPDGTHIQSVLFKKSSWTKESAMDWLRKNSGPKTGHDFIVSGLHETADMYHFRQYEPQDQKFNYRMKTEKDGITFIIGFMGADDKTKTDAPDRTAPSGVKKELEMGLKWHEEGHSGKGLVPATVTWARKLAGGDSITRDKAVKMRAWLARHEVDKQGKGFKPGEPGYPSPGRVAWALWGGDPAIAWSDKMVESFEKEDAPAEPSEQIKGSETNKPGSAKGPGSGQGIRLSPAQNATLETKMKEHNKDVGNDPAKRTTMGQLRSVYRRGAGAFSTSHRKGMQRNQWAIARVNAYLRLLKNGKPDDKNYTTDYDLLPKGHPKSTRKDTVNCMAEKRDSVVRFDRGELHPAHRSKEGFLYVEGRATRAGVFLYRKADGSILRELRPPEEVGNPDSLASLARKPITNNHPPEFVDAANADQYAAGSVDPEVVWEQDHADGFVKVRGTIMRQDAIDAIDNGRLELSCGYHADIEETSGVWVDAHGTKHKYDAIQRNIRYNHLALVDRGRAGKQARLRIDGQDAAYRIDMVADFEDLPIAPKEYAWDSQKAVARVKEWADAAEEPNEKYAQAFMWYDGDNADKFGAYKLPFADVIEGELKAVPRALNAISSVLGGGRGGVDISDEDKELVRGLIDKYREKMDMDHGKEKEKHMDSNQTSMLLVRVDDREYSVTEPHAIQRAIEDYQSEMDNKFGSVSAELEASKAANAEMQAKLDSVQAELDAMRVDSKRDDEAERIAWANERFILLSQAKSLKLDADTLTNDEIKREIVKRHFDGEENDNLESKAYVDSVYDYLKRKQQVVKTTEQLATSLLKSEETRGDDSQGGLVDAQKSYMNYINNIYSN
jgi:hypothetical protein